MIAKRAIELIKGKSINTELQIFTRRHEICMLVFSPNFEIKFCIYVGIEMDLKLMSQTVHDYMTI